eukprot:scaffold2257_cov56-Attheya_sp.AAC.2
MADRGNNRQSIIMLGHKPISHVETDSMKVLTYHRHPTKKNKKQSFWSRFRAKRKKQRKESRLRKRIKKNWRSKEGQLEDMLRLSYLQSLGALPWCQDDESSCVSTSSSNDMSNLITIASSLTSKSDFDATPPPRCRADTGMLNMFFPVACCAQPEYTARTVPHVLSVNSVSGWLEEDGVYLEERDDDTYLYA